MDDFERMMGMEGVRPLHQSREMVRHKLVTESRRETGRGSVTNAEPVTSGYTWVNGVRARTALETALERLTVELRDGRRGWATGICQNGAAVMLPSSSGAASLLSAADRQSLRLIVVGGDGWTFVMHPLMGVATLDNDPEMSA